MKTRDMLELFHFMYMKIPKWLECIKTGLIFHVKVWNCKIEVFLGL